MNRQNNLMVSSLAVFISLFMLTNAVASQEDAKLLTLQDALQQTLQHNKTLAVVKQDEKIAAAQYKQTEAIHLPQINLSYSGMATDNPLNAFGFKLQQQRIEQADFNPTLLNNPNGISDFMTKLTVQQPIINMDLQYMRKAVKMQSAIYQFKTQRTAEHLSFEVEKAFIQLQLTYRSIAVLEETLQHFNALLTFTFNRYQQGLLQKSDVLNVQVQIAEVSANLYTAKSNTTIISDYLNLLMGKSVGTTYKVNESIYESPALVDTVASIAAARADFKAMEAALKSSDMMIKSTKMGYLPKLNAFASYQLNDRKLIGFGSGAYLAGIQLSWDIFKGNTIKNSMATQTLQRNKLANELEVQKEQSQLEVNKTLSDIQAATYQLKQRKQAIGLSEESLRIMQNRYEQGLVNTTDVLMVQMQLSKNKLDYQQSLHSIAITKAYLKFLTTSSN
jgi:outer membrane protein TolC